MRVGEGARGGRSVMETLVRRLEAHSLLLSQRVVAEMYADDPFWHDRFGDRGRRFAEQDGQHHVSYLASALALSNPGILTGYARWLQSLLASRGMCTRHVAESFERLEHAIAADVPDAEPAVELLRAARAALRYDGGVARELQDRSEGLADAVVEALDRQHLASSVRGPRRAREDVLQLLAYLADALALARPPLFAAHVEWLAGFLQRRSVPVQHLRATLEQLARQLAADAGASEELRTAAHDVLDEALEVLSEHHDPGPSPAAAEGTRS
jgi:hypothetical protein